MRQKRVLALLALILISTIFPTGTALNFWENDIPENPGLPVPMSVENHYPDNLIPENPGLPELLNSDVDLEHCDALERGRDKLICLIREEAWKEYHEKVEECSKIEDEDEKQNCLDDARTDLLYGLGMAACFEKSGDEGQKCRDRVEKEYQAEKNYNNAKAGCRAKYEKGSEERKQCLLKARNDYVYAKAIIECEDKYSENREKLEECKDAARDRWLS